jgi:PST family polysaccharide transporter
LLAYVLIGKAQAMPYVVTEVAFTATLYLLTVLGTHQFGFDGAAIAYLLNYLLYLATMYVLVLGPGRRTLFPPAPATK